MIPRPILTADQMRAAEAKAVAAGTPVETLMERAGAAAATAIRLHAGTMPCLILCGPGNNGGDGYVIARKLQEWGMDVRVAAVGEPQSAAAASAKAAWTGAVDPISNAKHAPLWIDALFGTGLRRPLDETIVGPFLKLASEARVRIAIDLPSGVATDTGQILSTVPSFHLTITFGSLKPSHLLMPAAQQMGRLVVADIGVEALSSVHEIGRPSMDSPSPLEHKYRRGYAAILAGDMPGAAALSAAAALHAGAGYVRLIGEAAGAFLPNAVVRTPGDPVEVLADPRIGAVAVGPGLGRGERARHLLDAALASNRPLVLDADALSILAEGKLSRLCKATHRSILTPHAGEYAKLFPDHEGSKLDQALRAARETGCVIVYKGADTVVACPDGRAAIAHAAPAWLASAGTGDVLTGIIAALRSTTTSPFGAACAGVWLHGRAAELAGPALIADDLIDQLPAAIAECL
ncbi:NAD(P)H-hydrate dehydratase [Sphingosinicella rhizophila]|uniref:Bifunctional NAD(P)H-hydrate repair enzyme n=1 Tax=Sphingosinicella rhizophila TaxID=3050082 RepID=A0ABU3Q284_9SPHN|nr:NAD(P)H-hydrate dehydratase [Sphingosinicella sp. GR2756]MDT9597531.1 NAD(P)H-hydrate dehydratase [Sphingosinicella sp. GR2756]